MLKTKNILQKINKLTIFSTAVYIPLSLFFTISLIRKGINNLIFPSVPREGALFWIQLWVNNLFMIFLIGSVGFTVLLLSQLFRQYIMSPPFEISRLPEIEELNRQDTNRILYRAVSPIIVVFIGAFIPPVFGGWGYYVGGTILTVDKSNIANISATNSEIILSVLPNLGGITQLFESVPTQEGKVLFVMLSGLMVVSMWNLSYLSQIIFSPTKIFEDDTFMQCNFIKRFIYAVIIAYILSVLIEIL